MKLVFRLALFAAFLSLPFAIPASAQYMYLDANANGVHDAADRLNANGTPTTADLYVSTNQNRDGSTATCDTGTELLTINQYQIDLIAVGGTVTYSGFTNLQSSMPTNFGEVNPNGIVYKNGYGGGTQNAAGTYKLATLTITGATGTPRIDIVDLVAGSADYTGFGTACLGHGFDNVYRLDGPNVIPGTGAPGDFTDADGLGTVAGGNTPPTVTSPGNKTIDELALLAFTVTATDPDAGQTIAFSLDAGAPAGATINATSGAFSWTPTEAQGSGVYPITIRATDSATPTAGSGTAVISVTVNELNLAPVLAPIGNKTATVGTLLNFTASATDGDLPANILFFTLDPGSPPGASINTSSGVFAWTPASSGTFPVTVRVDDNGTPSLGDFEAISITVSPAANRPPVLAAIGNKTVDELAALAFTATATDPDVGQTLAFTLDAGSPAGAAITAGGAFSWTPTEAQGPGSYPVTIRVTDTGTPALNDFEGITIAVNELNVAPVLAAIGNKTATVGVLAAFTAVATDADLPANVLTFSLDAGAPAGATINGATGAFSWTPASSGTFPVTVRVTDNGTPAMSDFEAISITVSPAANRAPVLGAIGNKTVDELAALAFTATATDPDVGQTLAFTLDAGSPAGAAITTGGAFSWTPTEAQGPGSYPVTIRVTDNGTPALDDFENITITVNEVNQAPVLNTIGDKATTVGVAVLFTATATDADLPANTLAFSLDAGAPAGATINATTGAFGWTPSANGIFPVTVRVTDNGTPALSAFEAISIVVSAAPNRNPVLGAIGNKTVDELSALAFTATATDPDAGQTVTFSLDAGAPAGASIDGTTGAFSWTPTEAQGPGSYPVTIRVTDDGTPNLSDSEGIMVTVNEVNVAPVLAAIGDKAGTVGVEVAFLAAATDADIPPNALLFSLDAGAPAGAAIDPATGAFTWTPSATGSFPVTVRVTDDGTPSLEDFEAISINVGGAANVAPVLGAIGNKTVDEETLLSFTATATDADAGQTLAFSLDAGAPAGAAITAGGAFSWTPTEADGPGTFPVTIRVADNGSPALDDFEAITITVNEVNVAPVLAAIGDKAGSVGVEVAFTATATDADIPANALTFSLDTGAPAGATINGATGAFSWTPSGGGSFPVTIRVTDNGSPALDDFEAIAINVSAAANQSPVLGAIGNKTVDEETALAFTATATDLDEGQTLTFSLDSGAPAGAAITAGGAFSWTPTEADGPGNFPVTIRVTDNGSPALDDFEAITITVNEVNVAPVLAAIGDKAGSVGVEVAFTATATDADVPANTLTFSLDAGAPAGATINGTTGAFSFTPSATGSFPVTVRVTDNGSPALDDFEAIAINVSGAANQAPVLDAIGNKTVDEETLLAFTATATDPDAGQTLAFSLDAGAPSGAAITAGGAFSWTPTEAQGPGSYPVTIRVTDNGTPALDDFEPITITVNEVNAAPVLTAIGNKTGTVGVLVAFTASATDADIPVNTLTFSLDAGAPAGATIGASSGVFNWTPAGSGNSSVTVRVTDNGTPALSDFETIQIEVSSTETLAARAFFFGINALTILDFGDRATCVQIEPINNSYSNSDVDLTSIVMKYAGMEIKTGCGSSEGDGDDDGDCAGAQLDGDKNRNGVREIKACFSKENLRSLFAGLPRGLNKVEVAIEGNLVSGARFHDTVNHFVFVIGSRCNLAARPNPLNPETVLNFTTTQTGPVTVRVFDIAGRLVKTLQNGTMPAGFNSIRWDGSSDNGTRVATGVYFVKMISLDGEQRLRLTVLK